MEKMRRDHGRAAAGALSVLAMPPLLVGIMVGLLAGLVLAVPGIIVAMLLSIPHWLRGEPTP